MVQTPFPLPETTLHPEPFLNYHLKDRRGESAKELMAAAMSLKMSVYADSVSGKAIKLTHLGVEHGGWHIEEV